MITVVYHGNCLDGFGSVWAARKFFGDSANYVSYVHGHTLPELATGDHAYFVDLCPKRRELIDLLNKGVRVTILDHHKTAAEDLEGLTHENLNVIFDMSRSGAAITFNYFFPNEDLPRLLKWVQDRDIWAWKEPGTLQATETLMAFPLEFDRWNQFNEDPQSLLPMGDVLVSLRDKRVAEIVERAYEMSIAGHRAIVVNSDSYLSDVCNKLAADHPDYDFAAAWYLKSDGQKKWSLRSIGNFDVSAVAKIYGGGGHKNAAGFVAP